MKNVVQVEESIIPFNRPYVDHYISALSTVFESGHLRGNGIYTKKCQNWFNYHFSARTLLVHSCTAALEMAALLSGIEPGDEVIVPSYTFVSTANAFLLRGAKIIFADSCENHPNIDVSRLDELITEKTRVIIPVHYGGVACDMNRLAEIGESNNITIVEDAAHAIGACFQGQPLGSLGRFGTLSFHDTKNITCGEGGLLIMNREEDFKRAEIIWEKGTNRSAFLRGEARKYEWVDLGSSYLPSDLLAAVLDQQLSLMGRIQEKRIFIWKRYYEAFSGLAERGIINVPWIPDYATINGHLFYLECSSKEVRDGLIGFLRKHGVQAAFHYLPLHLSPFYKQRHDGRELKNAVKFSDRNIRLPLFYGLTDEDQAYVITKVKEYFDVSSHH